MCALGYFATYKDASGKTTTYTYDKQRQLTKAAVSGGATYSYTYDNVGNILTASNGTTRNTYTYGNTSWRDLLTAFNGQNIAYEGQTYSNGTVTGTPTSGNPISYYNGTRWSFDWEEGRQLTKATSGSTSVSYTYDFNGIRTGKTANGETHKYIYASGKLMRETITSGGTTTILDFRYDSNGNPHSVTYIKGSSISVYYYVTNLQGDVVSLVNSSGTEVASYTYNPYGKVLTATGSMAAINPLRYRGYY